MTKREFNQQCANYLKDLFEAGSLKVDPPDDLELCEITIQQPLAKDAVNLVLELQDGNELSINIDLA